jgi:hypothetical protein
MVVLRSKNTLLAILFIGTVIPIILPVVFVPLTNFQPSWDWFIFMIGILGAAHVGTTSFFYIGDRRYKSVIADDRWRLLWLPAILMIGAFLVFAINSQGFWLYFALHYAWLIWHFGRQNFGLYSFVAGANRSGPPTSAERFYFNLLPVAAIPKALTLYTQVAVPALITPTLELISVILTLACAVLFTWIVLMTPGVRTDWQRIVSLILGFAFFLPTIVSSNPAIALTFFAHPIQYIVMMVYLAGDRKQGRTIFRISVLLVSGIGLWGILTYLQNSGTIAVYSALVFGITQAHILIDSGAWKLKVPKQRAIITESYDFLFRQPPAEGVANLQQVALGRGTA